jgi:hypothetical protein
VTVTSNIPVPVYKWETKGAGVFTTGLPSPKSHEKPRALSFGATTFNKKWNVAGTQPLSDGDK